MAVKGVPGDRVAHLRKVPRNGTRKKKPETCGSGKQPPKEGVEKNNI
jgi:hypothetical protein